MSLDYVSRGESVKASTINSLIDAVAGSGSQSPDLLITGTKTGPQIVVPTQMGSTTFDQSMLYDVDNYILSAWPMAKLKLGFMPSDCLNGLNIYQDSTKANPISAVVVHYNSSSCPVCGGTLSGKLLEDDDFAEDKAVGATGWVKTSIEGIHSSSQPIKMQLWESISNLYQVFTNASDDDTKKQLSTVLNDHNVDEAELSTLYNVKSWPLAYQTSLSSDRGGSVPTSRLNIQHGAVDVYMPPAESNFNAVLKAKLVCYKVIEQDDELTSYWTWLLPMGPDAEYDQSNEVVHSSQLTFGQDNILIEAKEGDLDDNFNGDATWLGNTSDTYGIKYLDTCIAYGKYEVTSNSLTTNPVWLNLQYDYQKCAVVGNISLSSSSSEENQNVLANKIFVAKADDIQLEDKVKVGDEVHEDKIFFGTLGDLFKDGPKLDTYTPLSAGVYDKSLEWTTRVPEEEDKAIVSCRCMQLYNFDKAQLLDITSADWLVGRRYDSETSCAEIVYLPPDVPDSSVELAQTSSVQHSTVLTSDSDGNDISVKVLQLYEFNLSDSISVNLKDQNNPHSPEGEETLSGGYEFIIRKDNKVKYAKLSVDTIKVDTEVLSAQKSLEWKTTEDEDNPQTYMQLYGMDLSGIQHTADLGISGATSLLCDDYQFVIRRNGAGGEIDYLTLSVCLSSLSNSVSTIVSSAISSELSGLSAIPPDAAVPAAGLSSIQINEIDNNDKVLELYNFHALQHVSPLSTDDIVIRRTNHIDYVPATSLSSTLSTSITQIVEKELSGKGGIPPDADVPAANISSIQTYEITGGSKVLELFQFHDTSNVQTVYLSAQNRYDFLMRDQQTHQLTYANLSGVGGEVTLSGTDNSSHKGSEFKFQSADDSNIIVNVNANGVITIGCYYV